MIAVMSFIRVGQAASILCHALFWAVAWSASRAMNHAISAGRFFLAGPQNGRMKALKRLCRLLTVWMWKAAWITRGPCVASI